MLYQQKVPPTVHLKIPVISVPYRLRKNIEQLKEVEKNPDTFIFQLSLTLTILKKIWVL